MSSPAPETSERAPSEQLEASLGLLTGLAKAIEEIEARAPETLAGQKVGERLERLKSACTEAGERLASPRFRIATIGTTSSGKSTLVNAMIGRRLAPIESDEMSAGILAICHAERSRLVVTPTPDAPWVCGEWEGMSDAAMYERLRASGGDGDESKGVMVAYHEAKRKFPDLEAPNIRIEAPLLPVNWKSLLRLPDAVRLEIIDLPGLKGVRDRGNLRVIQDHVKNAFCLVVLDYTQTDDSQRAVLMSELKEVVEAMQGRTDAMLFVLNKVDHRTQEDQPLSDREAKLRAEIAEQLGLAEPPLLISLNAQLLYYVQCAWGSSTTPQPDIDLRKRLLEACFEDCAKIFRHRRKSDPAVRQWLIDHEDQPEAMPDADFQRLLRWAHEWSHGTALWRTLGARVRDKFPELVIFPAVQPVLLHFREFAATVVEIAKIRKMETRETVKAESDRIQEQLTRVQADIEAFTHTFQARITEAVEDFKKNDTTATNRAIERLGNPPGLQMLPNLIEEVRLDLFRTVIDPVRQSLKANATVRDLTERLSPSLPEAHVRRLTDAYDRFSRALLSSSQTVADQVVIEAETDDWQGRTHQEAMSRLCRFLFQRVREAMVHRAEFGIQKRAGSIEAAITNLLKNETGKITRLAESHLAGVHADAFLPDFFFAIRSREMRMPKTLFEIPEPILEEIESRREVTGRESYTYATGTCFSEEHTAYRDIYADKAYHRLTLPSPDTMALQWDAGVKMAEESLWEHLARWIDDTFSHVLSVYTDAIVRAKDIFQQEFTRQIALLEEEGRAEIEKWDGILNLLADARSDCERLRASAMTESGAGG